MDLQEKEKKLKALLRIVSKYYDIDALDYDYRYKKNYILKRIKWEFRKITKKFLFKIALDLGCGTGEDVIYFAKRYPNRKIYGIDASEKMVKIAKVKIDKLGLRNAEVKRGYIEEVDEVLPNTKFDLIYSYFGALNSVMDLELVAKKLREIMNDKGILLITVVNKTYLFEYLLNLALGRPGKALERVTGRWRGYSPYKKLPTRVLSYIDIKYHFSRYFNILFRRGFSIIYPPWYFSNIYLKITKPLSKLDRAIWRLDEVLNKTPLRDMGEYSLYILKPK